MLRLREEEAAVLEKSKAIEEENALLKEIMTRNGIPLPDRTPALRSVATVSVLSKAGGAYSLQVTMPDEMEYSQPAFDQLSPLFDTSMSISSPDSGGPDVVQVQDYSKQPPNRSPQRTTPSTARNPTRLDNPQVGIDFVLSLEQPCLGHTRHGDLSSTTSSGHALTAQAPLLVAAPPNLSATATWEIPAVEIDRLLELSSQLNLLGEVTPVQAWARIRSYPGFEKLSKEGLELLKRALMAEVQCYGYVTCSFSPAAVTNDEH